MDVEEILLFLKENLKNYKISNGSNKNEYEIAIIMEICKKIPEVIVVIKRNKKNNNFFNILEKSIFLKYKIKKNIELLLLNKDNYNRFLLKDIENKKIFLTLIKNKLLIEDECIVCYENEINLENCNKCCSSICFECLKKNNFLCAVCKDNKLYEGEKIKFQVEIYIQMIQI